MNIIRRIERLEETVAIDSCGVGRVPLAWREPDPFNNFLPMGPDEHATPAQLETWRHLLPMIVSVPYCPPA